MSACSPLDTHERPVQGGSSTSRPLSGLVPLACLFTTLLIVVGAAGQSHAAGPASAVRGIQCTEPLDTGYAEASESLTPSLLVYLPISSSRHPVGVCRRTITGERALELANNRAASEGLGPPRGYQDRFVRRAEMLTGAEHDTLYPDDPIVHGGLPEVEPWHCFWRIELDVYGMWTPSLPGSEPWQVRWFMALVDAQAGVVRSWALAVAPPTPSSEASATSPPTPRFHPTGTPTPRPSPSATPQGPIQLPR
jgi:hypothetical protein